MKAQLRLAARNYSSEYYCKSENSFLSVSNTKISLLLPQSLNSGDRLYKERSGCFPEAFMNRDTETSCKAFLAEDKKTDIMKSEKFWF